MSTNIVLKKKLYEAKKARDVLDEEFVEFLPKKRNINEFFNVYSSKFYILERNTHKYFVETSLKYIETWTHPKEIALNNIIAEIEEVQFEIDSTERFHPIIPNGSIVGVPYNTPEQETEEEWNQIDRCEIYYVQSGKLREIGRFNDRHTIFRLVKNILRKPNIPNKEFIIQVPQSLINTIPKGPPITQESHLNLATININTYQG
jgi:hypothetical protein